MSELELVVDNAADDADDRWTPDAIFRPLHAEHGFTIDVAASRENAKCRRYFNVRDDGLSRSWAGEHVWCNPPYSNIGAWLEKAWAEVFVLERCPKVVFLLPANRTEQPWWQKWIEPFRDRGRGIRTRNLPGRPRFGNVKPATPGKKKPGGCRFGCVVVVFERGEQR